MKLQYLIFALIAVMITATSCKKYLDEKPNKSLVVPTKLQDLQDLLDNNTIMNRSSPASGEASADNYFLTYDDWNSLWHQAYKSTYVWGDEITYDLFPNDWGQSYDQVYFTNLCLEGIEKIERTPANGTAWDNVKGSALFFRANAFLKVALTWANIYDSSTAKTDPGIPLRLHTDFNEVSVRATLQQSYEQVLNDLQNAVPLLPVSSVYLTRPTKVAAYGLLARTYLAMSDYNKAGVYADSCLQLNDQLMDYNTLDSTSDYPVPAFNSEMIFFASGYSADLADYMARVDTNLYASYQGDDLRKIIFFRDRGDGTFAFKGGYNGDYTLFTGIGTDEMYLTRAECFARQGNTSAALEDLNTLLEKRWRAGTFVPLATSDATQALKWILIERRKELPFRDLRWMDLKRLNKEPGFETTLSRVLNGTVYTLSPNEAKYALPIPETVIELSGMAQNPR